MEEGGKHERLNQLNLAVYAIVNKALDDLKDRLDKKFTIYDEAFDVIKKSQNYVLHQMEITKVKNDTTIKVVGAIMGGLTLLNGIFTFIK